jgi:hypothetical protein
MVFHDPSRSGAASNWNRSRWMHTASGRVVLGILLVQGLFYALRHLFTGIALMSGEANDPVQAWTSPNGHLGLQVLQVLAPALGAILAGAGHRNGMVLGLLVGAANGALSLVLPLTFRANGVVAFYGLPLLQTLSGAMGGWIGCTIWKPIQPVAFLRAEKKTGVAKLRLPAFEGKVAWFRVVLGSVLAVAGSIYAGKVIDLVLTLAAGRLDKYLMFQDEMVSWEIKALAVLLGAGIAGAGAHNGVKQGLFVGLLTGLGLLAIPTRHGTSTVFGLTLVSAMALSLAGGWFGSQLLPPLVKVPKSGRGFGPI